MGRGSMLVRGLTGVVLAALAFSSARAVEWVKDPQSACATSNPFPNPNESIRWYGNCRDGKLDGRGTLIWYRDGVETERNDAVFRAGEIDGYAVTRYPDGNVVHGQYKQGQRHGTFMTVRGGVDYIGAVYYEGKLVSQSRLSPDQAASWNSRGGAQLVMNAPPPNPPGQTQADAPVTGRTAVASPSRQLAPAPKPAAAAKPPAQATAAPAQNRYALGTQVADALPQQPQPQQTAQQSAQQAAPAFPAAASPATGSRYNLGTQVPEALTQNTTLSASLPVVPSLPPAQYPQVAAQPEIQAPPQQVSSLPQLPGAQAKRGPAPGPGTPTATTSRRPPWMGAGSSEPAGAQIAANAPVAPLPSYVPQAYPAAPAVAPMGGSAAAIPSLAPAPMASYAPAMSATEASRQYLAQRAGMAAPAQMAALPSYPPSYSPAQPAGPISSVAAMPGGGISAAGGAEGLFSQGYRLEMSGRFREAEQTYEQIILSYSSTQTAMLANERLNGLRRFTRDSAVKIGGDRQSQVVAVNEPRHLPRHDSVAAAGNVPGNIQGGAGSGELGTGAPNLVGASVCTQKGLYDKDARWCGVVRDDDGQRLSVEVRDIVLPGFGAMGIQSSKCTGNNFLNWFSKGSMVRVPRNCMEPKG